MNFIRQSYPGSLLKTARSILIFSLASSSMMFAGELKKQELVTIRNEAYRFEISVPKNWTYKKGLQTDPEPGMRSGEASFSISTGGSETEPENWNALVITSTDTTGDRQPYIGISAHEKKDQKPEEFAKLIENTVAGYGGTMISMNREYSVGDAKGFDCTYNLFVKCRYVALYGNGMRIIIHYYFPDNDVSLFEKHTQEVDDLIRSLRIR